MLLTTNALHVLYIEDNYNDALFIQESLKEASDVQIDIEVAERVSTGLELLETTSFDAILLDLNLPDSEGLDTFTKVRAAVPNLPIIVFTSVGEVNIGIKAVQEGAQDYLVKGRVEPDLLVRSIRYAIERKQIADSLASERERLAATLGSIADGVVATDNSENVIFLNQIAEKLTEWTQEEAIGKPFSEVVQLIDQKTRKPLPNPLEKVLQEGEVVVRSDFTILTSKNGKESFVSGRATPISDKDRGIFGAVISFRDISDQKMLEEKIFDAGQYDLLGEIASARILVDFPEQFWLSAASRSYPHVTFEILSILPTSLVGDPNTFVDTELVKINSVEWSAILEIIENHPSLIEIHKWDVQESEVLINVKAKNAFILRSLIESECILNYPIMVKNGQGTWELISARKKIDALLELFEETGISYSMLSINPYRLGASQLTLTKHQEMVLEKALALGYYEIPRRITLSELATQLNMAKSSLSGILRRISRNLVKK